MRKINYFIFPIVLVLFIFLSAFKTPLVNATQEEQQGYPRYLLKTSLYMYYYEKANASTHEYLAQYLLEGIATDTINDYFFTFIHYSAINKGYDNGINSYELEDIEPMPSANATLINVRFTFTNFWLNQNYGGYDHMSVQPLFTQNSAFYVAYNVYNWGYGDGFNAGRDFGRGMGYQEGYVDGHSEGYYSGYDNGLEDGYNQGYREGYEEGNWDGYYEGYDIGYDRGLEEGYDIGYGDGYSNGYADGIITGDELGYELGYQDGYDDGYQEGINTDVDYMQGYNDGFRAGEKSKIAQNNEAFYKSIEKWLVPAIITVIIAGGIVSIIVIKRREQ